MMTLYVTPRRRLAHMRQAMEQMFDEGMPETPAEREMLEGWTTLGFLAGQTRRARDAPGSGCARQ